MSNRAPHLRSKEELMPFKSEAQRRYFEANKSKLEKQGVDVQEWEQASKGMKLPEGTQESD
jgi:hypothetical protein